MIGWIFYGLFVGLISKFLMPGDDPQGFLPTVGIGIAGSFIGGAINWLLSFGGEPFAASGIIMGVIGGILACWLYRLYVQRYGKKDE